MTGEKLAWFQVASHLRMPVEDLAERITYREFVGWIEYLTWEQNHHGKTEHYLAQIAFEMCRSVAKEPNKLKLKDFLITFMDRDEKPKQDSKATWLAIFGLGKGKGKGKGKAQTPQRPKGKRK